MKKKVMLLYPLVALALMATPAWAAKSENPAIDDSDRMNLQRREASGDLRPVEVLKVRFIFARGGNGAGGNSGGNGGGGNGEGNCDGNGGGNANSNGPGPQAQNQHQNQHQHHYQKQHEPQQQHQQQHQNRYRQGQTP